MVWVRTRYAKPSRMAILHVSPMEPDAGRAGEQRGGGAGGVGELAQVIAAGHQRGPGGQQQRAGGQGGVQEVIADAAEELLDDDDGENAADHHHPPGRGGRHDQAQQKAGDHGGKVVHAHLLTGQLLPDELGCHGGSRADGDHERGLPAEVPDAGRHAGQQGDDHVEHQALRVVLAAHMRRGRKNQTHLAAASFFAFSAIFCFAILKDGVSQRRAGQMKAQAPHSMQSITCFFLQASQSSASADIFIS